MNAPTTLDLLKAARQRIVEGTEFICHALDDAALVYADAGHASHAWHLSRSLKNRIREELDGRLDSFSLGLWLDLEIETHNINVKRAYGHKEWYALNELARLAWLDRMIEEHSDITQKD